MTGDERTVPAGGSAGGTDPPHFDTSVAHQARVYDDLFGGKDNYAADRAPMGVALKVWSDTAYGARANRAFPGHTVTYLATEAGMRRFLNIGTGIPTAGNTHEVA